jgi:twitching motility protein PilI
MNATFPLPASFGSLAELATLAAPPVGSEEASNEIVRQGFRIGAMRLATPFALASELTEMPTIYPLPRSPHDLLGLVNLHGRIVPLFDLAATFGTAHLPREKRMLLVIGHGVDAAAIVIDGLPKRLAFAPEANVVPPALPAGLDGAVIAAWSSPEGPWYEIDFAQLFERLTAR